MKWYTDNVSPGVREFVEGALAFLAPVILEYIANGLGAGEIEPKTLLLLCVTTLLAYIRTRPTQHKHA
jgi:hypothetical protein